jgi:hypothetical protein
LLEAAVFLLGFAMYLWQLSVPTFLQLYDSGVYFAASLHLVSGVLPYRDFTFVQPPGILWLMSPVALLARATGTHDGFVVARVVSAFTTAFNAATLAWLVRHRGRVAMLFAGVGLALTPVAVFFSSGVRLEPYCLFFVLMGAAVVSRGLEGTDGLSTSALVRAGVLFGVAGAIEFWAFFPFVALALCLIPRVGRRVLGFVAGAGATLVALAMPFLILAPRQFVSQVLLNQLRYPRVGPGVVERLIELTGFAGTGIAPTGLETVVALCVVALIVVIAFLRRDPHEFTDVFLLLASLITVVGLMSAPTSYQDTGYFADPFLLGLFAVSLARVAGRLRPRLSGVRVSRRVREFVNFAGVASGVLFVGALVLYVTTFYSVHESLYGTSASSIAEVSRHIPAGSCVVFAEEGIGVLANRISTKDPHCPSQVDPFGISMAWGYERVAPPSRFVDEWRSILAVAQYLVVANPLDRTSWSRDPSYVSAIPWNASFRSWFTAHYALIYQEFGLDIYKNRSSS